MKLPGWLDFEIAENSVREYLLVFLALFFLFLLRRFFSIVISRIIYKLITKKGHSDTVQTFIVLLSKPLQWLITLLVIYFSIIQLDIPAAWQLTGPDKPGLLMFLNRVFEILLIISITFLALRLIDFFALEWMERPENQANDVLTARFFLF